MPTQTRTFQRRVLDEAARRGELEQLVWFVEMKIRRDHAAAPWPGARVPVIPVGDDAEISRCYADVLTVIFEDGNRGAGLEFAPALTDRQTLAATGVDWYEWSDWAAADIVCPSCAAIGQDCICEAIRPLTERSLTP